jgi:aspartyl-tRNA(Asn)/glutamyl-tRNA(Gln) amidotransferase subunit B
MLDHPSDDLPTMLAKKLSIIALAEGDASLEKWCHEAIETLPDESEAVRKGNLKVVNKLVGKVMKASRSTADAVTIRTMLLELLAPARGSGPQK